MALTDIDDLNELVTTAGYLDVSFMLIQAETTSGFDSSKIGTYGFGCKDLFSEQWKSAPLEAQPAASHLPSPASFSHSFHHFALQPAPAAPPVPHTVIKSTGSAIRLPVPLQPGRVL
jgi:hypothetical protein